MAISGANTAEDSLEEPRISLARKEDKEQQVCRGQVTGRDNSSRSPSEARRVQCAVPFTEAAEPKLERCWDQQQLLTMPLGPGHGSSVVRCVPRPRGEALGSGVSEAVGRSGSHAPAQASLAHGPLPGGPRGAETESFARLPFLKRALGALPGHSS